MGRTSLRDQIVTSGATTVHKRGFATVGLREISAAAGVAQGSFTNHFRSKDDFGLAVLDHYFEELQGVVEQSLKNKSLGPIERLRNYFSRITALLAANDWRYGCLAGNMALEASEHSEALRERVSSIFARLAVPFAETIREAQQAGEVDHGLDSEEAAAALLEAWHGAMLRMKVDRSEAPIKRFTGLIFPALLLSPIVPETPAAGAKNRKRKGARS